jgi:hypothetical protein
VEGLQNLWACFGYTKKNIWKSGTVNVMREKEKSYMKVEYIRMGGRDV